VLEEIVDTSQAHLNLVPESLRQCFDREPFGFTHNLGALDLFQPESLRGLAEKHGRHSYYVAASAPSPGAVFYSVPSRDCSPLDAFDHLESGGYRILLKRPEEHDSRFRELLQELFRQVIDWRGGLAGERVVRLESGVFISSAATTTPFHFDPEVNFFAQIEGEKIYHVYSPRCLTEADLEPLYVRGVVDIGQVNLAGRDKTHEHVFHLTPGKGLHQPQNAPHWVETRGARSVSYAFVFETDASRARGRVRAFNYYLRKLHLAPAPVGARPRLDNLKSGMVRAAVSLRRAGRKTVKKVLGR
jgi:hypothetical protein